MSYNIRPRPSLIDPSLLGRVNKIYISKHSENNSILEWIYKSLYPYFKDNFIFTAVVIGLIIYLIYRYLETIKKKNRIIQNINNDAPIPVKIEKPIDYDNEDFNNSDLSDLDSPQNEHFDKEIENELQMNNVQELNNLPPELVRQQIGQQMGYQSMGAQINQSLGQLPMMSQQQMGQQSRSNKLAAIEPKCGSIRPPTSMYEPMANNTFSDNFMDFNLM